MGIYKRNVRWEMVLLIEMMKLPTRDKEDVQFHLVPPYMKQGIGEFCKIKHYINDKVIGFSGTNAVDFYQKFTIIADEKLKLKTQI